jgi:endonuclease III
MPRLWDVVTKLEKHYGKSHPPLRDPFELILYENIAYLASDDRREQAFRELKKRVGTRPADLLTARAEELAEIAAIGGIFPALRARRLQESARLVRDEFGGDLGSALKKLHPARARKALKKFPTVGDPGADKILLFTGAVPVLALESNGLRVMVRLGFARDRKNYSAMYKDTQAALKDQTGTQCAPLIAAHQILKRHGQELCRRSTPRCEACPLQKDCPYSGGGLPA